MKKLFTFVVLALVSVFAFAGSTISESVSDGYTVRSRTLDGRTLTSSVCQYIETAEGTHSRCVTQVSKLSKQDAAMMRNGFEFTATRALNESANTSSSQGMSISSSKGMSISAATAKSFGSSQSVSAQFSRSKGMDAASYEASIKEASALMQNMSQQAGASKDMKSER